MFILRECRRIAAETLDLSEQEVGLQTHLGDQAGHVLSSLYDEAVRFLAREQIVDDISEADEAAPTTSSLQSDTVAAVASAVTSALVRVLVSSRLDVPLSDLSPSLNFALDLGADSLTRVDLVLLLEETLEVSVPDDSMFLVQTVGDAELFATLFDRAREDLVITLGESARDLTFDTPLERFSPEAARLALEAAARSVGHGVVLPQCPCKTLKDAVRLGFLAEKLRRALADAASVEPEEVGGSVLPGSGLSLDGETTRRVIDELATSMDLGPLAVDRAEQLSLNELIAALVSHAGTVGRGE